MVLGDAEKTFYLFGKIFNSEGSEGLLDPHRRKCATLFCHSFDRTAEVFTLLSPPFSVIAPLCVGVGGGGGGRSHYNRCFMRGLFSFCLFH